ncbi:DUF2125 domain-containing protein [Rhodobacteraceae bacterium]|nr:DUF2125 domain-containing protein [Paracoccaceae bacterium]
MTLARALTTSSVLALLAGPALADLTAEEVLADQLNQMSIYGLNAQALSERRSGNVLTVDGLTATAEIPGEDVSIAMTMGGAIYTEQGDGSVLVTYPDEIPLNVLVTGIEGEDDVTIDMTIRQAGTQSLVTGSPEQFRYEYTSQTATVSDFVISGPEEAANLKLDVSVDFVNFQSVMNIASGDIRPYDLEMSLGLINMLISGSEVDSDEEMNLSFDVSDLVAKYAGTLSEQSLMDSFATTIEKGNTMAGTLSHGTASYVFDVETPDGQVEGSANMASADYDFSMDENGLDYGGVTKSTTITVGGSAIPLPPMTFQMAEYGGRFKLPVVPGEDPQDFAMALSLVDVVVDPFLWSMFDPTEQLPRDPATVVVDMSGELVMLQDVFDPEFAETMGQNGPPGQINALDVNQIKVSLAGAELTGDGALTFNNDTGLPVPAGIVNIALKGGNTLLDTLVGMGLLPEEQAMGARMMSGLFARPGTGPDTLVSTIEMNEDGSILANGQRIK